MRFENDPDHWLNTGFATRAIHAGQDPDPTTGAVTVPIHQTSTFKQDGVGNMRNGYEYSRSGNPTRTALEEALAAAEAVSLHGEPLPGGARGFTFASGLAAEDTLLRAILRPGDHVVIPNDAYGGTYRLIARVFGPWGIEATPVPISDAEATANAIRPGSTKLIWVETPSNPLMGIADIEALAEIAHQNDALLVVDNTFASPYLQTPLTQGADVVVHSTTKYVGGHSDVVGGALVVPENVELPGGLESPAGTSVVTDAIGFHQNSSGAVPGPFDCWLALRGLKTLSVRMERHSDNAEEVAQFLEEHSAVTAVHYPGLLSHPQHSLAGKQMRRFGGMLSFQVGSEEKALEVCDRTKIFTLAESLGGVESLIEHPGKMTHAAVAGSDLEVPSDLVRISVGIEDAADLIADLDQALR